jgi:GalNAc5-diNAcBac-PP-undecaprenol beta-1,3-glucosyltransferase
MSAIATVVVPTHSHATTLPLSVASALRQTLRELEVVVLGDGVDDATRAAAEAVAASDDRVRFVDRPKGERHGELHRHALLGELSTPYVLYLSDDDLWFPDHARTLVDLLAGGADAAGARFVSVDGAGRLSLHSVDLAAEAHRDLMRGGFNRVGLSGMAHTLEAYRRLPHGWRTTPRGTPTDLYMWQQWIAEPSTVFASAPTVSVLNFPDSQRPDRTDEQRAAEIEGFVAATQQPEARLALLERLLVDEFPRQSWLETHYLALEDWQRSLEEALEWHKETLASRDAALAWHQGELERTQGLLAAAQEAARAPAPAAAPEPAPSVPGRIARRVRGRARGGDA